MAVQLKPEWVPKDIYLIVTGETPPGENTGGGSTGETSGEKPAADSTGKNSGENTGGNTLLEVLQTINTNAVTTLGGLNRLNEMFSHLTRGFTS